MFNIYKLILTVDTSNTLLFTVQSAKIRIKSTAFVK